MNIIDSLIMMLNEMAPYILLGFFIAGLIHAFVPRHTMGRHLSGTGFGAVFKAAMIGVPLPLCSCGVLPTAIAMRRAGASRAATTSFLVATPQTGVDSIAATWSLLGPAFAVVRPVAALVTALFGGVVVGKASGPEQPCTDGCDVPAEETAAGGRSFARKMADALRYGFVDLVGSIGVWLVAGLIIAALITVFVPADFFATIGASPLLAMLGVLVIAIPMYICATGSIPIALSLMLKGLSPGTALVLLMAGPAANFASFTLISREMGRRTAALYLGSIILGAVAFGLAIDYLLPAAWFVPSLSGAHAHGHVVASWPSLLCSAVLVALLVYSFILRYKSNHKKINAMTKEYTIRGMNCPHCRASVEKCIAAIPGVRNVSVSLADGKAVVDGDMTDDQIVRAVHDAGFEAIP